MTAPRLPGCATSPFSSPLFDLSQCVFLIFLLVDLIDLLEKHKLKLTFHCVFAHKDTPNELA